MKITVTDDNGEERQFAEVKREPEGKWINGYFFATDYPVQPVTERIYGPGGYSVPAAKLRD